MRWLGKCALAALALLTAASPGCARVSGGDSEPLRTVSAGGGSAFGGAPAVEIPSDARAMAAFLKAEVATNEGDREEALKDYADAVRYDPNNASLRVRLATLYVRDGRLKDALEQVNRALATSPDSVEARLLAAGITSALGDDKTAEQDYKEVLKLNPKSQEAYLYLGTLYAKRGDYAQAEKTFDGRAAIEVNDRGRIADAVEHASGAVDGDVGVAG